MRALITGGAGFIGSHLARALVERGDDVMVLDDLSSGHGENLDGLAVKFWIGSVLNLRELDAAMVGVDYVFHLAARPSLAESVENPQRSFAVNVQGTLNVLEAARAAGVKRVVYAASSSAYGDPAIIPTPEDAPLRPVTPYAAFKLQGELLCQSWRRTYGLETVCLRYFNVYGPRQDPSSPYAAVIPRFIEAFRCGEPPVIFGKGRQSRDFIHVGDVVRANLLASTEPMVSGQILNVGTGIATSLLDLVKILNDLFGTRMVPRHEPARHGDVPVSLADITELRGIGFRVTVPLIDGLRKTVEGS